MGTGSISFAFNVKEELMKNTYEDEQAKALLSAILKTSGSLIMRQNRSILKFTTENAKLAKEVFILVKRLFQTSSKITVSQSMKLYKNYTYNIEVRENVDVIMNQLQLHLDQPIPDKNLLKNNDCIRSYLAGVFLAVGSVNSPENSNYHLEMAFQDASFAHAILKLANKTYQFDFKLINRRSQHVIYIKKSDMIVDFLIVIGATNSMFYFEDLRSTRDFTNSHNRLTNCLIANEVKSLNNAKEQVRLIKLIDERVGIDLLDDRLKEIALLRLEHEEASLSELSNFYQTQTGNALSKSGINHRLKEIEKIANNLNTRVKK